MYQFLCDLQAQGKRSGIGFNWGKIEERYAFLPRVVYRNIILSKAMWRITKDELAPLLKACNNEGKLLHCMTVWRKNKHMPQYVQLVEGDNTLLVNLENVTTVELLLDTVRQRENFVLKEFLFTEESIVNEGKGNVSATGGRGYANQFVVSFYNQGKLKSSQRK